MQRAKKHIVFILPGPSMIPSGGPKMVFEYANRFTKRGLMVSVAFDCGRLGETNFSFVPRFLRRIGARVLVRVCPRWFPVSPDVQKLCIFGIKDSELPRVDAVIATAVGTAERTAGLSRSLGQKFYFVQGYETWGEWTPSMVDATYRLGMTNIVVAKWLKEKVEAAGAEAVLIPNGIDTEVFNIDVPPEERKPHSLSMMYRTEEIKGAKYGVAAILQLKKLYPDLEATLFGPSRRPADLPEWVRYVHSANQPQLRKIYNGSAIYLYPSIKEGFGLTGAEAMACGCAYVSSDYGGQREYATEGRNVLLSPPRDVEGLVRNVCLLFEDDALRVKMAYQGYEDMKELDWEKSVDKFEQALTGHLSNGGGINQPNITSYPHESHNGLWGYTASTAAKEAA